MNLACQFPFLLKKLVYTKNRKRKWTLLQFDHMGDKRSSPPLPPSWHCYVILEKTRQQPENMHVLIKL